VGDARFDDSPQVHERRHRWAALVVDEEKHIVTRRGNPGAGHLIRRDSYGSAAEEEIRIDTKERDVSLLHVSRMRHSTGPEEREPVDRVRLLPYIDVETHPLSVSNVRRHVTGVDGRSLVGVDGLAVRLEKIRRTEEVGVPTTIAGEPGAVLAALSACGQEPTVR